jgi:hypothetical protein
MMAEVGWERKAGRQIIQRNEAKPQRISTTDAHRPVLRSSAKVDRRQSAATAEGG